jgi:hypothetical protein
MIQPIKSLAFAGSRAAIERCRQRPNRGPTVLEAVITTAIIADPILSRAVKARVLSKPWSPPAARKSVR